VGGVGSKRGANVRADGQKPDRRRERWASGPVIAKPICIKDPELRFGGGARKAVEIISGGLLVVADSRLRASQGVMTHEQKSAEGVVLTRVGKARTVSKDSKGRASKQRDS
jgi:hypothetical protein